MITLAGNNHLKCFQPNYNVVLNIQIIPAGGGVFNPTSYLISGTVEAQMDQACATMTLTFHKGSGVESLAPLVNNSNWNINGPLLYGGCIIFVGFDVTDPGGIAIPSLGNFFAGRITSVNTTEVVTITCLDIGAFPLRRQIQIEKPYGGPMEDVLMAIHTDNGGDPTQLIIEGVPDFTIDLYMQQPGSVLEAMRLVAQQRGWDLRYFQGLQRFRCYDPDRERIAVDATFSASDYIDIDRFEIDDTDVRNQVRVWYAQETGGMATVYMEDAASIFQHGPNFVQIPMRRTKNLMNLTVATRFCALALEDMKDPLADQQVTLPFFPIVELNDFYEYVANPDFYDQNQRWAIAGYTHDFALAGGTTTLQTRGKPIAAFRDYRRVSPTHFESEMVAMTVDDPPAGTYLDGLVFPEKYLWLKTDDLTIPTV